MPTLLFTHPDCLDHLPGAGHPECAERLQAVIAALEDERFATLERRLAPLADEAQLARIHPVEHVRRLLALIPERSRVAIDPDTAASPGTGRAALRAAGAVCAAVDAVVAGEAANAFCAVRPPGHHAEPDRAMGFCLFNNIAIGAAQAHAVHGLERVAIVDFDVHHGNGTQAVAARTPWLFFGSTHQAPLYPGTGAAGERGLGNIVNAPLPPGADGTAFRTAMTEQVLPALEAFAPELVLVSAGFDGHARDPLAHLRLREADFAWATGELLAVAARHCGGRLVSVLEGGYDLAALGTSAAAHVDALMAAPRAPGRRPGPAGQPQRRAATPALKAPPSSSASVE